MEWVICVKEQILENISWFTVDVTETMLDLGGNWINTSFHFQLWVILFPFEIGLSETSFPNNTTFTLCTFACSPFLYFVHLFVGPLHFLHLLVCPFILVHSTFACKSLSAFTCTLYIFACNSPCGLYILTLIVQYNMVSCVNGYCVPASSPCTLYICLQVPLYIVHLLVSPLYIVHLLVKAGSYNLVS